ncbi:MAG TPA: hypothetical protein VJO99_27080 [Burkholderiaceae bacterium]|nr:hypothetical protein [Burkholderiaceae bacterium]
MKTADSKLLARLDAALAATRDPIRMACLRAERAGYRARQGRFDRARKELDALRLEFALRPHPEVSVWLCLLEGWLAYYGSLDESARGWMKRAYALSAATDLRRVRALSAAWLALTDYAADDAAEMVKHLEEALHTAALDDHDARARACLVAATAFDFVESKADAQKWYTSAREHARAIGDEQMLSAINYNIASQGALQALQAAVFDGAEAGAVARRALTAAEATVNYDGWIGTESLNALTPITMAVLWSLLGDHAKALSLYETHGQAARDQGLEFLSAVFLADIAWCRWHAGAREAVAADLEAARGRLGEARHADDRAVAHGRMGQVCELLGRADEAREHRAQADAAWAQHRAFQRRIAGMLAAAPTLSTASHA